MDRAAFLADEDVTQRVLLEDRVVDRQYGATGIAEDILYALIHQRLEDDFRTRHLGLGGWAGGIGDGGHLTSRFLDKGYGHGNAAAAQRRPRNLVADQTPVNHRL